jgi:hypothetical protein
LGVVLAGYAVLADKPLIFTQPPQRVGFNAPVTELPGEDQRLGIVLAGDAILPDESLNLS